MALQDLFINQQGFEERPVVEMPSSYRETAEWVPKLGDIVPDFHAESTHGRIDFHDNAEGRWSVLFGYPEKRGGISETEIVSLCVNRDDFAKRGVQVFGISPCTLSSNVNWRARIESAFNTPVTIPLIADAKGRVCEALGMHHPKAPVDMTIRKTMVLDPSLRLRWMAEYPSPVGRSIDELMRVIDALQMWDDHELGAPMDWLPGDDGIVRPDMSSREALARYGNRFKMLTDTIRTVKVPTSS